MHRGSSIASATTRDLRIDWLRGLAMTCVIVNHSKLSSVLSWFSYERFWIVTAAEVFVVLSGVVLGTVYGRRLARDGWRAVVRGLGRRAALLYGSFIGVTLSVPALARLGVDVTPLTGSEIDAPVFVLASQPVTMTAWRDVLLMRAGPWAFQIVGLYVCLVAAAIPCLLLLHRAGWRVALGLSWALYLLSYRLHAYPLTPAGFETTFPLLSWQLLFVHGITIGYHRRGISGFVDRGRRFAAPAAVLLTAGFAVLAFCNPWTDGPAWLRVPLVAADNFTDLYERYFALSRLGIGRLLNLAVSLPVGYGLLTRYWGLTRPLRTLFVTLGQRSLGAFVLHVYGILMLAQLPLPGGLWVNTGVQVALVCTIAGLLHLSRLLREQRRVPASAPAVAA